MISVRLLCLAGLLAGAVSCSVPASSSQGRDVSERATAMAVEEDQPEREESAGSRSMTPLAVKDPAPVVRDRINGVVVSSQRSLEEAEASCEKARAHLSTLVAQLASLRSTLEAAGVSDDVLARLGELEQDSTSLNGESVTLLSDLETEQSGVREFRDHLAEMESQPARDVGEVSAEKMSAIPWRKLEAEVSTYEGSGSLQELQARSDRLARGVAALVARFSRVERESLNSSAEEVAVSLSSGTESKEEASLRGGVSEISEVDDTLSPKGEIAEIRTSEGTLLLEFLPEDAPKHVENFKRLVKDGFYDNLTFHRILPGYVIQGGCPRGDGSGGPGWQVDNEFNAQRHRRGTLSMARFAHPDSAGSQFFICLDDRPELNGKQTVFGRVIRGEATLQAIEALADPNGAGTPAQVVEIEQIVLRPWEQGDNEPRMIAGNPVR